MKDGKFDVATEDLDTTLSVEEAAKSVSSDDALLMSMGKMPELKRVYNFWTRESLPSNKHIRSLNC